MLSAGEKPFLAPNSGSRQGYLDSLAEESKAAEKAPESNGKAAATNGHAVTNGSGMSAHSQGNGITAH